MFQLPQVRIQLAQSALRVRPIQLLAVQPPALRLQSLARQERQSVRLSFFF
jgi:hypothetical protein